MLKRLISIRAPPFLSMFKCSKTGGYLMREEIYKAFLKEIIWEKIKCLDETEKAIIVGIFYENKTEAEVGSCLGMSQQLIHYKKVKIIEKLKKDLTLILKEDLDN